MITTLLVIIGLVLLFFAVKSYLIGNEMTLDQLEALTQAIEDFTKTNKIIACKSKNSIIFEPEFVKAVKVRSLYLSNNCKGFAIVWKNGRTSHFIADSSEELACLLKFALLLRKGFTDEEDTAKNNNTEQTNEE